MGFKSFYEETRMLELQQQLDEEGWKIPAALVGMVSYGLGHLMSPGGADAPQPVSTKAPTTMVQKDTAPKPVQMSYKQMVSLANKLQKQISNIPNGPRKIELNKALEDLHAQIQNKSVQDTIGRAGQNRSNYNPEVDASRNKELQNNLSSHTTMSKPWDNPSPINKRYLPKQ